eukprot:6381708-Prymnesium_polylepis.1
MVRTCVSRVPGSSAVSPVRAHRGQVLSAHVDPDGAAPYAAPRPPAPTRADVPRPHAAHVHQRPSAHPFR